MAWVLLDDNFPHHPKAVAVGPLASYLFVCGLCYCRKYHTGGFIPDKMIASLGVTRKPVRMIEMLIAVGLWDQVDGGFHVHGYESFYADYEEKILKETIRRERQQSGRKGGQASAKARVSDTHGASTFASSTDRSGTGEDVNQVQKKKKEMEFGVFWHAYPRHDGKQAARLIWLKLDLDEETQRLIAADIERRARSSQWLKDEGQFVPHARTYLSQKRWEDGFEEIPRLSERTINVLKGFEEPKKASR